MTTSQQTPGEEGRALDICYTIRDGMECSNTTETDCTLPPAKVASVYTSGEPL